MRKAIINVPNPSYDQVEHYHRAWDELENYHLQEDALDKLFFTLCPENTDMSDILLKVAALNDFYSTNIFSVYPVAKHIRTPLAADITYLVMKPLEWIFLLVLYLTDRKPEDRIAKQYL